MGDYKVMTIPSLPTLPLTSEVSTAYDGDLITQLKTYGTHHKARKDLLRLLWRVGIRGAMGRDRYTYQLVWEVVVLEEARYGRNR